MRLGLLAFVVSCGVGVPLHGTSPGGEFRQRSTMRPRVRILKRQARRPNAATMAWRPASSVARSKRFPRR